MKQRTAEEQKVDAYLQEGKDLEKRLEELNLIDGVYEHLVPQPSLEIAYSGKIDMELDKEIQESVNNILSLSDDLEFDWYFSEATTNTPHHRLQGWMMDRPLNDYERINLQEFLLHKFKNKVFIIR